ncbi:MAG: hypothetical protein WC562_03545 [Dehalococcoidia bacterium]
MKARIIIYTVVALYLILTVVAAVFVITEETKEETAPAEHESSYYLDIQQMQISLDA